jgi:hypothetical protein
LSAASPRCGRLGAVGGRTSPNGKPILWQGEWYRWFVRLHEENPGARSHWGELHEVWWNSLIDTAGDPETWEIDVEAPEVREELHPLLARDARTDQFLADRGVVLSQQGRDSFLSAVFGEFLEATKTLRRRASGDWGPDQHEAKLSPAGHSLAVIKKGAPSTPLGKAGVRGTSARGCGGLQWGGAAFASRLLSGPPTASATSAAQRPPEAGSISCPDASLAHVSIKLCDYWHLALMGPSLHRAPGCHCI